MLRQVMLVLLELLLLSSFTGSCLFWTCSFCTITSFFIILTDDCRTFMWDWLGIRRPSSSRTIMKCLWSTFGGLTLQLNSPTIESQVISLKWWTQRTERGLQLACRSQNTIQGTRWSTGELSLKTTSAELWRSMRMRFLNNQRYTTTN